MFVCDINEQDISGPPASKKLKKSQCTPLFMNAYTMRGRQVPGRADLTSTVIMTSVNSSRGSNMQAFCFPSLHSHQPLKKVHCHSIFLLVSSCQLDTS